MVNEPLLTADRLFECMCNYDVGAMNFVKLISVPALANYLETSKYRVRKCMEELKSKGLVASGCECFYSDYDEQQYLIRGFHVTEQGRATETHKLATEKELELIERCFGDGPDDQTPTKEKRSE